MQKSNWFSILALCLASLAGCSTGVMYMGGDAHQINEMGFSRHMHSTPTQRRALRKATAYCSNAQKVMIVDNMSSQDGVRRSSFPKAELKFRCVDPGAPALKGAPTQ